MNKLLLLFILCGAACAQQLIPPAVFDGPAEMPRVVMTTTVASTPSPNLPKIVGPEMNLQTALNSAICGDTLLVDPTIIYTGSLQLPSLPCDAQHWITITSSGTLPDEFTRIKPTTSLPRIILPISNSTIKGGVFVRFIGFEVTRLDTGAVVSLITPGAGAHDLIFDRMYVHGTKDTETRRGFELSNTQNVAIVNSYVSDFHCMAVVGTCTDAQAVAGGLSSSIQDGNYLIRNNYMEGAAETIIFGGGPAGFIPQDITVQYNDFAKPDSWNPADPSYSPTIGKDGLPHPWVVKNLFELKNGRKVLVEGNRMVGSWGGFTQTGGAILLTPKNQSGSNGTNQCPICAVEDVTIRNNWVSKAGAALQLAYARSDNGGWPADSGRFSIHDNQFDRLQYATCYLCGHYLTQISAGYDPLNPPPSTLHDISVRNNSFYLDGTGWLPPGKGDGNGHGFLMVAAPPTGISNIVFTNNVVNAGNFPIFSTGGGTSNCFTNRLNNYATALSTCWIGASAFTSNVILNSGPGTYPAGNYPVNSGSNTEALQNALANRR